MIRRMDEVFKALADPTRRSLLDELFKEDGQTLSALEQRLPMTRFGVMKHLRVLEEAGLVTTKRRGREKLHFLNPVPIRLVHDRWVSKYAEPWAATLSGLKQQLEDRRWRRYSRSTSRRRPERLWEAITDTEMRQKYNFGVGRQLRLDARLRYEAVHAGAGIRIAEGENLEVDPPRRLVQSFNALWSDDVQERGHLAGHLGDRAGRGLMPADRHPRPAARGRQRRALRRLADDPLRPEDAARDRRAADHARLAALFGGRRMSVETKLVTGVDFVCVPTQDIAKAMDFYENVLGLEPSKRWQRDEDEEPMGAEFEPGDVTIALLNTGKLGIEFQASKVPVAYQVGDVEAARAELESRGVTFVADTMDSGVCHMAHFTDPDGNVLMLHNRYAPKGERPGGNA